MPPVSWKSHLWIISTVDIYLTNPKYCVHRPHKILLIQKLKGAMAMYYITMFFFFSLNQFIKSKTKSTATTVKLIKKETTSLAAALVQANQQLIWSRLKFSILWYGFKCLDPLPIIVPLVFISSCSIVQSECTRPIRIYKSQQCLSAHTISCV